MTGYSDGEHCLEFWLRKIGSQSLTGRKDTSEFRPHRFELLLSYHGGGAALSVNLNSSRRLPFTCIGGT